MQTDCYLYVGHPENIKRQLVTECLIRALGLPGLSVSSSGSVLAAWADTGQFSALTDYDLMMIRVLYDDRIEPGMNAEQAHRAARQIHQELTHAE